MSAFFTDAGKPRLIPNDIARPDVPSDPSGAPHAGAATPSREPRPRVRCYSCGHSEPGDLIFDWSWLEQRYVPMCADFVFCELRERGLPV